MSHNQVQIQFITPKSINIHLQSVLVKLFYSLSTKYASCRILSCLFPLSSHVPISLFFCRLNYLPHPFQLFQILSILQDPNSLQQHKMYDLLPGPGFNKSLLHLSSYSTHYMVISCLPGTSVMYQSALLVFPCYIALNFSDTLCLSCLHRL